MMMRERKAWNSNSSEASSFLYARSVVLSFCSTCKKERPDHDTLKHFFPSLNLTSREQHFLTRERSWIHTQTRAGIKSEKATLRSRVSSRRERERKRYLFLVKRRVNEEEEEEKQTQFEFFFQFNFLNRERGDIHTGRSALALETTTNDKRCSTPRKSSPNEVLSGRSGSPHTWTES